ncbi:hypothetical protein N7466_010641 [Penicillium verhagenii]|uniref:uncharacterized protein n=1 Tax=Penicillium verhagenii TaxID=1562060 RepID=UPI0025455077|nr:uncharacterized protein N7466_010641 [Penicillium verhagenii]KAJ5918649.1 hypothetical protein N7466_010641 [Penicillium verhagenii]
MNLLFPAIAHTPSGQTPGFPDEPEQWPTALKNHIKEKIKNRSSASSTKSSTKTIADDASIHSTVSTATTLKGTADANKKKWFSLSSKPTKVSDKEAALKAVHNEAVASYFSMR